MLLVSPANLNTLGKNILVSLNHEKNPPTKNLSLTTKLNFKQFQSVPFYLSFSSSLQWWNRKTQQVSIKEEILKKKSP